MENNWDDRFKRILNFYNLMDKIDNHTDWS